MSAAWMRDPRSKWVGVALVAIALIAVPFALAVVGTAWVRITNFAVLFVLLSLGLNIVVGFAGLLDLGYIAFYAVGAYVYALLASPHFGLHLPWWMILPIGAFVACLFGIMLGAPTLKLRGDYLAIVTLGFGEIVRIFMNNLSDPINITNGPKGISTIDSIKLFGMDFGTSSSVGSVVVSSTIKYYFFLLAILLVVIGINFRLQNSRIGRAWEAIREDEMAARAMGINTTKVKLLAFAMGASFAGVAGGHVRIHPGLHQSGKFCADRKRHGAFHGGAGRHGQYLGRGAGGGAALVRARVAALYGAAGADGGIRQNLDRA